jgi:hypothetical protein
MREERKNKYIDIVFQNLPFVSLRLTGKRIKNYSLDSFEMYFIKNNNPNR